MRKLKAAAGGMLVAAVILGVLSFNIWSSGGRTGTAHGATQSSASHLTSQELLATSLTSTPQPGSLTPQQKHDRDVTASPAFWKAVHNGLKKIGPISLRPGESKSYTFYAEGIKIVVNANSLVQSSANSLVQSSASTPLHQGTTQELSDKIAVTTLPCGQTICVGSRTDTESVSGYNVFGIWLFTIYYHVPFSWNIPGGYDNMGYPYWTYTQAWFEAISSKSDSVYSPVHGSTWYWSSGGWWSADFISSQFGGTLMRCDASNYIDIFEDGTIFQYYVGSVIYLSC